MQAKRNCSKPAPKRQGRVKLIDLVKARLDAKNDCFVAELPSVRLDDVRIADELVHSHDRMLTGGFYAEVDLAYDPSIAEERSGRPFGIESLREIQLSKSDVLESLYKGRERFSHLRNGKIFSSAALGWSRRFSASERAMSCFFAWSRSSKTITTP